MLLLPLFTTPAVGSVRLVFLGDSLTAGYGLDRGEAFPALLEKRLRDEGFAVEVVNAGVSGDTSAGGLRRIDWVLSEPTDILLIALGGNDGLRGLPTTELAANLSAIIDRAREKHADLSILLAGMRMPASMGERYAEAFASVYPDVAREKDVGLIPFLLEGVAGNEGLNLPDGIHPNKEGQVRMAETVWPYLVKILQAAKRDPTAEFAPACAWGGKATGS